MGTSVDLHGDFAGIVAYDLLVDLENSFKFPIQSLSIDVSYIEVDHGLAVDAHAVLIDDFEDGAGGYVSRYEVAVLGIPLFEEVPALGLGDGFGGALVVLVAGYPDAATFASG
jgi:hypothetical protein